MPAGGGVVEDGTVATAGTLSPRTIGGDAGGGSGGGGVTSRPPPPGWRRRQHHRRAPHALLRRAADAAGAALLLALLAPSLLAIALLLRAEGGGGAVLTRWWVVGRAGREFALLTFRVDPTSFLGQLLGASGVAALPMLLNVLRGDMALVGPAPMTRAELAALRVDPASIDRPGMIVQ